MISLRFAFLFGLFAAAAAAQTAGASLQGAITDPSGALIPHARVEIHNINTGAVSKIETDASGRFRAPRDIMSS